MRRCVCDDFGLPFLMKNHSHVFIAYILLSGFFFRLRNVTFERLVISLRTILMDMMCVWAFNTCIFDLFCAVLHEMAQGNDNKIT